jgi:hypothetical protein
MGELIHLVPRNKNSHKGEDRSSFSSEPEIDGDEAVTYYQFCGLVFLVCGMLFFCFSGISILIWNQTWSALFFICLGGFAWIITLVCQSRINQLK